jgi:hypothetical protein
MMMLRMMDVVRGKYKLNPGLVILMSPGSFPSQGIMFPIVNKTPITNRMIPAAMSILPICFMGRVYIPHDIKGARQVSLLDGSPYTS